MEGLVRNPAGAWQAYLFLVDTGADSTQLPYRTIQELGLPLNNITVLDDLRGVGSQQVPYFQWTSLLALHTEDQVLLHEVPFTVLLDPHGAPFPLLGRDVLDHYTVIIDRHRDRILLLDESETYEIQDVENFR